MGMALVLLLSLLGAVPADAAAGATLTAGSVNALAGDTVQVDVTIKNNPGVLGATLTLEYDRGLTLTGAANGPAWNVLSMTKPGKLVSPCNLVWDGQDLSPSDVKDGVVLSLTFQVSADAKAGDVLGVRLSYVPGNVVDANSKPVSLTVANGSVTVLDYVPGDVNGDGSVTTRDIILLRRYLAGGYGVSIQEPAGNVNDDGTINSTDIILIRRFLAGGYLDENGDPLKLKPSHRDCAHVLTATPFRDASCTENGNIAFWTCSKCGKLFRNAEGTAEISRKDTVIPATGHTVVIDQAVPATATSTGLTEGSHCSVCGTVLVAQKETPMLTGHNHAVTYDVSNGDSYLMGLESQGRIENGNPGSFAEETGLTLKNLSVPGYRFLGWYDLPSGSNAASVKAIAKGTAEDVQLYAHWEKIPYIVQFESPAGSPVLQVVPDKTYTVDTGLTLPNLKLDRYTFMGWSNDEGELVSRIEKGSTGNLVLTANWTSQRNQTKPVKSIQDPLIVRDDDQGVITFAYELGIIENVPLFKIKDLYNTGAGVSVEYGETNSGSIGTTEAQAIAETVSNTTTRSASWTLAKEWNQSYNLSHDHMSEVGGSIDLSHTTGRSSTGTWNIGGSLGGTKTTTTENSISGKIHSDVEIGATGSLPLEGLGDLVELESKYKYGGEIGGEHKKTKSDQKTWNLNAGYEHSSTVSHDDSISMELSKKISDSYHYGESFSQGGSSSASEQKSSSKTEAREYSSTVSYNSAQTKTTSTKMTLDSSLEGYFRLICAGTVHVFAVVGYDIADCEYFVYTYNVMDDETYTYIDYSKSPKFDDYENGVLPFEVPIFVEDYINTLLLNSEGLEINTDTGVITGYSGEDTAVFIPEYMSIDNLDGTRSSVKVTGISSNAFNGNTSVVDVILPDSVTAIPDNAFTGCTSLRHVYGKDLTSIGSRAFSGCTSLASFTVPETVTALGESAFAGVPEITVNAGSAAVAEQGIASGAKRITVDFTASRDLPSGRTYRIGSDTDYFALLGGGKQFDELVIQSEAAETVLASAAFRSSSQTPLVLSSPAVTLNQVTVEAPGLALELKADAAALSLYRNVQVGSSGSNAVKSNDVSIKKLTSGGSGSASSSMSVAGNFLVYGTVTGQELVSFTKGGWKTGLDGETTYTLSFDPNGGSCGTDALIMTVGSAPDALPEATRSNYSFDGWFTAASGGTRVTADNYASIVAELDPVALAENGLTLYSHWTANNATYSIVYRSSNGTGLGSSSATYPMGTTQAITPPYYPGYDTPSAQTVAWDSPSKTITFTYYPSGVGTQTIRNNDWWWKNDNSHGIKYTVTVSFSNRTASSVTAYITWTNTITANTYYGAWQSFSMSVGNAGTGSIRLAENSTWSKSSTSARSVTKTASITLTGLSPDTRSVSYSASASAGSNFTNPGSFSGSLTIPTY